MRAFDDRLEAQGALARAGRSKDSAVDLFAAIGAAGSGERVSVADMRDTLEGRAFGMAALVFSLPVCFPMPPGVPTVAGAALLMVSVQMILGKRRLWLPRFLRERSIGRAKLKGAVARITPRLRQLEKAARPRLLFLTGGIGQRVFGLVMLVLAAMLILPIPIFGNMPLGFAAAILALGLIERDGAFVLAGLAATAVAIAVTGSFALLAIRALGG